jgi:hypothetical protein
MDPKHFHGAADELYPPGACTHARQKRSDPIDHPRLLGIKRSALQARKHGHPGAKEPVGLASYVRGKGVRLLTSADGSITFVVCRTSSNVIVEKHSCPSREQRTAQAIVFDCASQFDRWCDNEPIRFLDPRLYRQLREQVHEALELHR